MKFIIPFVLYVCLSWLAGGIVLAFIHKRAPRVVQAVTYSLLFGGPFVIGFYIYAEQAIWEYHFNKDVAYVKQLCAKDGGDKIYRTVEGVEGIFQMTYRGPDTDQSWRDQFGMPNPWARALGDSNMPALAITPQQKGAYWFLEQRTSADAGPPFLRKLSPVDKGLLVQKLRSRYGYLSEDLTTPEMRARWIGAGRIKIIDLGTNEVLAERKGYFRAIGAGPDTSRPWIPANAITNGRMCPSTELAQFVRAVLHPIGRVPTQAELGKLTGE